MRTTAWNRWTPLYGAVRGGKGAAAANMAMLWILYLSDGTHSVLDIAERASLPFAVIVRTARLLKQHGLLRIASLKGRARPTSPQLTKDDWQPFEAGGDRRKSNNGRWCFYFAKMGQCRSLSPICVTGSGQLIAKRGSS